eukprot:gene16493-11794_t
MEVINQSSSQAQIRRIEAIVFLAKFFFATRIIIELGMCWWMLDFPHVFGGQGSKCKQTLRGHVDSVNAASWQPFSANVCTASGDKTVSVWDGRTGLCVQTLYGHANSCNHLAVTNRGDIVISADADGVVKVWDIRMVAELGTIDVGQYPVNKLAVDRGGSRAIAACDDGTCKVLDMQNFQVINEWAGHDGPMQCVAIAPNDGFAVSGASDCTFRIWGR